MRISIITLILAAACPVWASIACSNMEVGVDVSAATHTTGSITPDNNGLVLITLHSNKSSSNGATLPTSVVYNGSLSGGPNKSVTLQAVLKDATGKALAGRTITFKLGAQTASAVTDANGVAKTTLQLTQKNGNYSLTATFAPTGLDDLRYTGGAAAATFSLKK